MSTPKAHPGRPLMGRACRGLAVALCALAGLVLAGPDRAASAQAEPNRAGLVVRYEDGRVETRCVELQAAEITGADLLVQSGLDAIVDASSGLGITVCRIEGQGCDYPSQPCFCSCSGTGPCAYWNYYYRDAAGSDWTYAPLGALLRKVKSGSVDAWVWGDGNTPPAADLTFEAVCAEAGPTAAATVATVVAQAPAVAASPLPVIEPTGPGEPEGPAATSSPASASTTMANSSSAYLLFGVMAVSLLVAAAAIWLRGRRR